MTVYPLHFLQPLGDPDNPRGQAQHYIGTPPGCFVVVLLLVDNPRGQAQHYIGSTDDLAGRLASHRVGHGAAIMRACAERRIDWALVRTWPGGRTEERELKRRHKAARLCPICRGEVSR